jgi:hypothetical protein
MEIEINVKNVILHVASVVALKQTNVNLAQIFLLYFKKDFVQRIHHVTLDFS